MQQKEIVLGYCSVLLRDLLGGKKRENSMQENRRFCLQVFSGDTVENVFSDVATSKRLGKGTGNF
jgi:hypothetical protein